VHIVHRPRDNWREPIGFLQDWPIKKMRLRKISTIEKATEYLLQFIEEYNTKFVKEARNGEDAHRPMREKDDLERIFTRKATRKLSTSSQAEACR
jgi:hypothetical protein